MRTVPMSVQDALWLTMDRPNNLMVVDGAMVLEGVPDPEQVRAVFAESVRRFPVLARRPVPSGTGWAWTDDPDFDLDRHLEEVELPEPADIAALQQFLAEIRSQPLPKDRPLWRGYLIPAVRLPDGSTGSAYVSRFHHSIADGVRLTQVMLGMCEADEAALEAKVARRSASEHPGGGIDPGAAASAAASGVAHTLSAAADAARHPRHTIAHLPRVALETPGRLASAVLHGAEGGIDLIRHPDRLLEALEAFGVENVRPANDLSSVAKIALGGTTSTVWSGKPGSSKAVAWSDPVPLARIKAFGKAHSATVNDVLLTAVAGGLRRYLEVRGEELDEVLWMVPVNLKPFAENLPEDLGNYFALVFLPMPLGGDTSAQRLDLVSRRMQRIKHSDEAVLTFGLQRIVSMSPGQVAYLLTNFFANKAVGVLTNVPGPQTQLSFAGVPVRQIVGFAPCSGDQPMTATIFSYNGGVTVGFATDTGLIPSPHELVELVMDELAVMLED